MDWLNIFFFIALIYFFSSIQKRRKNGRAPEDRPDAGEREDAPAKTERRVPDAPRRTRTESRPAPPPAGPAQGGYDYDAFRKKLRRAWKLDQPDAAETEETTAAPVQMERSAPKPVESAPRPAQSTNGKTDAAEQARQQRYAEYLRRAPAPMPAAVENASPAPAEPASREGNRRWTEQDVRQWMVYDAVFGTPRSRRPWTPLRK